MSYQSKFTGAEIDEILEKAKQGCGSGATIDLKIITSFKNLLINILKAAVFTSDQTENLKALEEFTFGGDNPINDNAQVGSSLKIVNGVVTQNGSNLVII